MALFRLKIERCEGLTFPLTANQAVADFRNRFELALMRVAAVGLTNIEKKNLCWVGLTIEQPRAAFGCRPFMDYRLLHKISLHDKYTLEDQNFIGFFLSDHPLISSEHQFSIERRQI